MKKVKIVTLIANSIELHQPYFSNESIGPLFSFLFCLGWEEEEERTERGREGGRKKKAVKYLK